MFAQEGSYDVTPVFWEMAWETNLLDTEIYEVQEVWTSWWGLKATNHAAKASQRDMQFFHTVTPTESPNIMGLKGIHFPKSFIGKAGAPTASGVQKEGQNEGTVINHLWTIHYHLCLVCILCMDFFATSVDTMGQHAPSCKSMATEDKDQEEEEESKDDDSDEDDRYLLEEI